MIRFVRTGLLCLAASAFGVPAWAQFPGNNSAVSIRPKSGEETLGPAKPAAPPALPGARSSGAAAPAAKSPYDMSPNEALFDAINRGDIAAARDALSRGADLSAQNVLGMTPMELSVDLGRNDISFLLLSMRSDSPRRTANAPAQSDNVALLPTGKPAKGRTARPTAPAKATAPAKVAVKAQNPDRAPRLFADDGGPPAPAAGFLGFGGNRTGP